MDMFGVKKETSSSSSSTNGVDSIVRAYVNQQTENVKKKNDIEIDLLTKIRNYSLKRSAIEHEYGQALQSLRQQYCIDERSYKDLGFSNRSLYGVWNSYLDETKRLASKHTSMSQFYAQNIGSNLKNVHATKMEAVKKCTDELKKCTQELVSSSAYTEKYRKAYVDAFNIFTTANAKFKSKTSIIKKESTEKTKFKLAELEKSVVDARNLYLIRLEATRTHRNWFARQVLPKFIQETDGHVYESLWTYLSAATCIEVENYETAGREFKTFSMDMEKMPSSDEHRQQFLGTVHVVPPSQSLEFEPHHADNIFDIRQSCPNDPTLTAEAKTWVSSHIRAQKIIDETSYKVAQLDNMARYADNLKSITHSRNGGGSEISKTTDELKDAIRRAEINKIKAEAILDKLRAAGVNIDELTRATGDSLSSYSSYGSQRSNSHVSLSTNTSEPISEDAAPNGSSTDCIALYSYEPKSPDELRIVQGEVLQILENLDGNPWPRAKNQRGQFGLVPCNYIKPIVHESGMGGSKILRPPVPPKPEYAILQPAKSMMCIARDEDPIQHPLFHCKAKYGYPGKAAEELPFSAGDILAVLDDAPHDVLDGWYKGTVVDGRSPKGTAGTFPSMLVERIPYEQPSLASPITAAPQASPSVVNVAMRQSSTSTVNRRSLKTWYGTNSNNGESTSTASKRPVISKPSLPPQTRMWKSRVHLDDSED